jgi:hypothetical protein
MSMAIVDGLEAIDFAHHDAQAMAAANCEDQLALQRGVEIAAVEEAGQGVAIGLFADQIVQGLGFTFGARIRSLTSKTTLTNNRFSPRSMALL